MEKYARQALAEGVKNVTDLVITTDSELYRVLVLHYNRNNQIEVQTYLRNTSLYVLDHGRLYNSLDQPFTTCDSLQWTGYLLLTWLLYKFCYNNSHENAPIYTDFCTPDILIAQNIVNFNK